MKMSVLPSPLTTKRDRAYYSRLGGLIEGGLRTGHADVSCDPDLPHVADALRVASCKRTWMEDQMTFLEHLQQVVAAAFMAGVEYGEGWLDEAPEAETEATMYAQRVTSDLGTLAPTDTRQGSPERRESDPALSAGERRALRAIRRLVAATAKSCSQQQDYNEQVALLDRLLGGGGSAPAL